MLRSLIKYFGFSGPRTEETENISLLRQFVMRLNAGYLRLSKDLDDARLAKPDLARVREILATDDGSNPPKIFWRDAYEIEQLLVSITPAAEVRADLIKAMSDIKRMGIATYETYRHEYDELMRDPETAKDGTIAAARAQALLLRMLDDIQWRFSQRYYLRNISQDYMFSMFLVCAGVALLFALALFTYKPLSDAGYTGGFTAYPLALTSGLLGAAFSILTGRQEVLSIGSIEHMRSATHLSMVLLRLGVGAGAAAILYFMFDSGFVTTSLFPKTTEMDFTPLVRDGQPLAGEPYVPNSSLRLLIVWCFIAGFSEKLVPAFLASRSEAKEGG